MSWTKTVNLECDAQEYGCLGTPNHIENEETVAAARAEAAKHGWVCQDGRDICPVCLYVLETGCHCEIVLHDDGDIVRLADPPYSNRCEVHNPRNSRAAGR